MSIRLSVGKRVTRSCNPLVAAFANQAPTQAMLLLAVVVADRAGILVFDPTSNLSFNHLVNVAFTRRLHSVSSVIRCCNANSRCLNKSPYRFQCPAERRRTSCRGNDDMDNTGGGSYRSRRLRLCGSWNLL